MRLACQENLLPGETLSEKLRNARQFGFEGVEVWGKSLWENFPQVQEAFQEASIACSTICGGQRGCLLDPDPKQRKLAQQDLGELLQWADELGAVGVILVPVFGRSRLPDLTPLTDAISLEKDLLVTCLQEVFERIPDSKSALLLEPLNRYETHFLNRLTDAVEICERLNHPRLQLMADFFHMNIEEPDIPQAIKQAGKYISHVHLADSHRKLPGTGHTDFQAGLQALQAIGYDGCLALECAVEGDPKEELPKTVEFLKSLW